MTDSLAGLLAEVRACRACADLPLGPRPVLRAARAARLMIVGQAPGTKVHETGIPWNDASGRRLREWLQLDSDTFYDPAKVAIIPMGFCYPGVLPKGGDKPPRPECARLWHARLHRALPNVELTLLVGGYAQAHYLPAGRPGTVTETVRRFHDVLPDFFPTPHPSWRTTAWQRRNPWFEAEVLPELRRRVHALVGDTSAAAP